MSQALHSPANAAQDEREAIRAAAGWYARLCSGSASEAEQREWQRWLAASELNRQAWTRVENVRAQLGQVPGKVASPTLLGANRNRRRSLRLLGLATLALPLGWLGRQLLVEGHWRADFRTAVGERRRLTLADGSALTLDTGSAVDFHFDAAQRLIRLHAGRILIATAPDPQRAADGTSRPFRVRTRHGLVQALGTRFTVQVADEATTVAMLDHSVRIQPAGAAAPVLLHAGQQLSFTADSTGQAHPADASTGTWAGGSLVAVDMPLGRLVEELARYRSGVLRCDPAIAQLKISGAFPLDDTDRALALLEETFPLRRESHTRYWVELLPR